MQLTPVSRAARARAARARAALPEQVERSLQEAREALLSLRVELARFPVGGSPRARTRTASVPRAFAARGPLLTDI
jgi:hypothetical protein